MSIKNWLSRFLLTLCFGLVVCMHADAATKEKTAHVTIPFDFWIQDTKLPAGTYELKHVSSPTLVVFTSSDRQRSTEAFMLPVNNDPVEPSDAKLVFLVEKGEHYLYEAWGIYGRRIITAQYGIAEPSGNRRLEVPVVYK